jgi:hypothetical protein
MYLTNLRLLTFEGLQQLMDLIQNSDLDVRRLVAALGCF